MVPIGIYLAQYWLHFELLPKSGEGDEFMSIEFQSQLIGNPNHNPNEVPFGSNITIKHFISNAYLNTIDTRDPANPQHPIAGASAIKGGESYWILHSLGNFKYQDNYIPDDQERQLGVRYLRTQNIIRLQHSKSGHFLAARPKSSPQVDKDVQIVTLDDDESKQYFDDTLWNVLTVEDQRIVSSNTPFVLTSLAHQIVLKTDSANRMPAWGQPTDGREKIQQEVVGSSELNNPLNYWRVIDVLHDRIIDGVEIGREKNRVKKMSFFDKLFDVHLRTYVVNNGMTTEWPLSSRPADWIIPKYGLPYWESKWELSNNNELADTPTSIFDRMTKKNIYLTGNLPAWAFCALGFPIYLLTSLFYYLKGSNGEYQSRFLLLTFMVSAYIWHYIPFFFMKRQLYLHHYFPAYIFSIMMIVGGLDFIVDLSELPIKKPRVIPSKYSKSRLAYIGLSASVVLLSIGFFVHFYPLCYGLVSMSNSELKERLWLSTWTIPNRGLEI